MLLAFHLGRVCIFALHNNCLWHTFYSGAVTLKLFVTFAVLCFVPYFFCVCACVCVRALVCIKETRQLSTIQLPNFLRRLKWKVQILVTSFTSTRFACLLRQQCFLSSLQSFQGSGSLPWLGTCALKPTVQHWTEKDIFEPIAGQPWCSPLCFYTRCPYGFLTSSAISVLHFSLPALPRQFAWSQPSLPVHTYDTPLGKPLILLLFTAVLFCRIAVAASASPYCRVLACACSHFHCWAARLFVSCTLLALVSFLFYLMGIIFAVFVLLQVVQECRKQATDATELWPRWFRRHCLNAIGLLVVLLIC